MLRRIVAGAVGETVGRRLFKRPDLHNHGPGLLTPSGPSYTSPGTEFPMSLKDSKTAENLQLAFASESLANRRYLYFAQKADSEGLGEVAAVFRSAAESETGHAHGHLEYLEAVGDPVTGLPFGGTAANLETAIASETQKSSEMYPAMAKQAREEGFDEIADWFETLARAQRSNANRLARALETTKE